MANDSCQELSCELAGEGGAPIGSVIGQVDDFAGKASWEAGGLGARNFVLNGLNGPRGKGSTRGRGGNRRSSLRSAPGPLEDKERTLLETVSERWFLFPRRRGKNLGEYSRKRALTRVVTRHRSHFFEHGGFCLGIRGYCEVGRKMAKKGSVCDM